MEECLVSDVFTNSALAHAYMRQHLASIVRPVIFELGGFDGQDTSMLLSWAEEPELYAFEPDPRNVARFANTDLLNGIRFYPAAIGHVTGGILFHLATADLRGNYTSSSISPFTPELTKRWPWLKCEAQTIVQCWRLDDFCEDANIDHIDLIWMDVQGAERLVFAGAPEMLKRTKLIWTEHDDGTLYRDSSTAIDVQKMLPDWKVIADTGSDMLLENPNAL